MEQVIKQQQELNDLDNPKHDTNAYFAQHAKNLKGEVEKKLRGMALAASRLPNDLDFFRVTAETMWEDGVWSAMGDISIDDVRFTVDAMGYYYVPGNWIGSVFKVGWVPVGFRESTYSRSHARIVRTWRRM